MNNTTTRATTLRARLIAEGVIPARAGLDAPALDADDPFAGDDILWAEEDWARWTPDDGSWLTFSYGLTIAVVLSALIWVALAGSVFFVYRILD
ncbi:MAG: hypothetical protein QOI67_262 [Gaiellaceae bacterium]|jgi:hypothetical protein|nr:hypothetical protein [Gaiellaceae bacterium]